MCCVTTLLNFQTALKAQLLKPEMVCHKGHSQINCMQAISNGYVFVISKMDTISCSVKWYNEVENIVHY